MANRAMHDYINIKTLSVSVPLSEPARSLARGTDYKSTMSREGVAKLQQAINSTSTPLESVDVVDEESDPAVAYEKKQTVLDTIRVARDTLNDNDWSLFSRHYLEKETTDDIAISERVTRQAIEKKLKRCVNKVTKAMNI
jgi:DNA-directed RNA polymerase specialized sigma24 family protein